MNCTYTYPTGHQIKEAFWSNTLVKYNGDFPDLSNDTEYSQRLQYLGDKQQNCTVRLSHVTLKDEHMYYFRFITDKRDGKWIGDPGVTLNVTDLQVESPERVTEGDSVTLTCKSSCALTDRATFIWYINSLKILTESNFSNKLSLNPVRREDSGRYSCAVDGHTHISPAVQLNVMFTPVAGLSVIVITVTSGGLFFIIIIFIILIILKKRRSVKAEDHGVKQISDPNEDTYTALELKSTTSDLYDTLTTVDRRPRRLLNTLDLRAFLNMRIHQSTGSAAVRGGAQIIQS
ncbi:hypothetical protein R3I94_003905 [Phoxinus phoxinus]